MSYSPGFSKLAAQRDLSLIAEEHSSPHKLHISNIFTGSNKRNTPYND
jgi:hypothetical protein